MSFLTFDEKTNNINIAPEAKNLQAIQLLKSKDTTTDKINFNNAMKFIYHSYKKDHIFANLSINERKVKTSEMYLNNQDYKKFDSDENVRDIVRIYIDLEYSQNEWAFQQLKNDIENIKANLNDIPLKKWVKFEQDIEVEIKCDDCGKKTTKTITISKIIEQDNSKERMDAMKQILQLQDMEEKLRDVIKREKKMKEHNQDLTLLEQKYF